MLEYFPQASSEALPSPVYWDNSGCPDGWSTENIEIYILYKREINRCSWAVVSETHICIYWRHFTHFYCAVR